MKTVELVGKTKEEALEEALKQLGTTIEHVKVEYDEQKSGGIFGFLAKKEFRVKVTLLETKEEENKSVDHQTAPQAAPIQEKSGAEIMDFDQKASNIEAHEKTAVKFIADVFESIGITGVTIETSIKDDNIEIKVFGEEASRLIGRRGDSLDSLQMLTNLAVNRGTDKYSRVLLDIENYRAKREESLQKYAVKMAKQATRQKRILKLEPMNPYERRIVHSVLQNDRYVKTYSEGKDPYRRVVIEPKYKNPQANQ